MTPRNVLILLAAGVILIGLSIWVSSTRHLAPASDAGHLVIPGLEAKLNSITQVTLKKGDDTRTTLKKGTTGWIVGERGWPADSGKVRKLLLQLADLTVVEDKTRLPENYPLLGVEDVTSPKATGTLVTLVTPAKRYSLIIGKSFDGESGFVRVAGSPQSLLAKPLMTVDADPKTWLDSALIDLSMDRVKSFDVKPAQGRPYSASRKNKAQEDFVVAGVPRGRKLTSPAAADPIAGALSELELDDVQKAPAKVNGKVFHVVYHTFDGLNVDIAGHKEGTTDLVTLSVQGTSKSSAAEAKTLSARFTGWEFELPSWKYDTIFQPLDSLLQKPPAREKARHRTHSRKKAKAEATG